MVDKYNRPGNDLSLAISKEELAMMEYDLAVEGLPGDGVIPGPGYGRTHCIGPSSLEQNVRHT